MQEVGSSLFYATVKRSFLLLVLLLQSSKEYRSSDGDDEKDILEGRN